MPKKIVYAYAVADILHVGHLSFLEKAKAFAGEEGKLIVGILTDEAVMEKKPKPTLSFDERIKLVKALKCVDIVVAQQTYSPISNIKKIKPDILIESDSHPYEDLKEIVKASELYGGKIIVLPYYHGKGSTKIKREILNNWNDPEKNKEDKKEVII